ncbi:dihydroxyacetone kinase [Aerococcus urinaeequi]|uniref:phosphoenolpyruvate--glycerone phosphotransferase n=1 Tax=Aerococcus urinaeequi TaxID=51665 RepID=A0AAC8X0M5_9LACT|nr:dihydroxyacetone kinase subunit DhaK [Aerococcus urinaeequi]ALZ88640.1 dihydroxyacetone kinase [Aerococcus urinaeequi]AMB97585.1 dihydroxyacetone kinase [Aerococcus urinaeequi]QGS36231.1 dihydroxyacetone kinase subunit DhaK [Aerococcus viridans]
MKKIINQPGDIVSQMVKGLASAHADILAQVPDTQVLYRTVETPDIVGIVSGGGSGHEPSHAGFVGKGMLSAAVSGEVFTSPTPDQILEGIKAADNGAGVFLVIKNYTGDVMNFEIAQEFAEAEGIETAAIIVDDDIAMEDSTYTAGRRGIAGTVFMHKIIGYYADQGKSLSDLKAIAEKVNDNLKSIGLALTAATVPEVGKPGFDIADDEFEYGIGIHGEPGYRREKIKPAKEMAAELIGRLKEEFNWTTGDRFAVLVNGMGGTPLMELYLFWNDIQGQLGDEGVEVDFVKVGDLMTSLEMQGASLTLLKLEDADWVSALQAPVNTAAWG